MRNEAQWQHALAMVGVPLALASSSFIADRRAILEQARIPSAVQVLRPGPLADWMLHAMNLQGISNDAALAFEQRAGPITLDALQTALAARASCPRLQHYWALTGCGYRRGVDHCAEPAHRSRCPVPPLPARKGALAVGAVTLALFVRDVCDGDLIGWIDERLEKADVPGLSHRRGRALAASVAEPLAEVSGIGPKVANMLLGDLLLAADPTRQRWVAAGAAMVAVDSLVHAWLHRTGILHRFDAVHAYGPRCYAEGGCVDIIEGLAHRIDARTVDPKAPTYCPRLVQHAIWHFCAGGGANICNGNRIEDTRPCAQMFCPAGHQCDRVPLNA